MIFKTCIAYEILLTNLFTIKIQFTLVTGALTFDSRLKCELPQLVFQKMLMSSGSQTVVYVSLVVPGLLYLVL